MNFSCLVCSKQFDNGDDMILHYRYVGHRIFDNKITGRITIGKEKENK